MALDPNLLNRLADSLVELYGSVEREILSELARRLAAYDYRVPAARHQRQKREEPKSVEREILTRLSARTGQTREELILLLSAASAEAIRDDLAYYTAAHVYDPSKVDKQALHARLNNGLLQTQNGLFRLTKTIANTASVQFERALDRAWTRINTGAADPDTAIKTAITDLAKQGIGAVRYKSGRTDSIETAVRRAVLTGANQTAMKTQELLADELEVDLVEVTAHSGARPDHAKWQGKVFSRRGKVTIDGVTYEDLAEATGYGKADGLGGVNCRHSFHPYLPGTTRSYRGEQREDQTVAYNGKSYTEYEASQIQRGLEREIRKQKRTVAALKAAGLDTAAERKRLRHAQTAYTDFTEQTGRKKQPTRTLVGKAGSVVK